MLLHACKNVKRARYTGAAQTLWLLLKREATSRSTVKGSTTLCDGEINQNYGTRS